MSHCATSGGYKNPHHQANNKENVGLRSDNGLKLKETLKERMPSDCLPPTAAPKPVYDEAWAGRRDGPSAGLSANAIHPKEGKYGRPGAEQHIVGSLG
eukprot:6464445-Amphidinium_carterae.2